MKELSPAALGAEEEIPLLWLGETEACVSSQLLPGAPVQSWTTELLCPRTAGRVGVKPARQRKADTGDGGSRKPGGKGGRPVGQGLG